LTGTVMRWEAASGEGRRGVWGDSSTPIVCDRLRRSDSPQRLCGSAASGTGGGPLLNHLTTVTPDPCQEGTIDIYHPTTRCAMRRSHSFRTRQIGPLTGRPAPQKEETDVKDLRYPAESATDRDTQLSALRSRLPYLVALPTAAVLTLSACGGGGEEAAEGGGSPAVAVDEELAAMVPEEIAGRGVITIGVDSEYPPAEFLDTDGQTVLGFDVELFDAVAGKLGLETKWQSAQFDAIITGVDSGKYDVGVSSFTITAERLENVTMVSYLVVGTQRLGL